MLFTEGLKNPLKAVMILLISKKLQSHCLAPHFPHIRKGWFFVDKSESCPLFLFHFCLFDCASAKLPSPNMRHNTSGEEECVFVLFFSASRCYQQICLSKSATNDDKEQTTNDTINKQLESERLVVRRRANSTMRRSGSTVDCWTNYRIANGDLFVVVVGLCREMSLLWVSLAPCCGTGTRAPLPLCRKMKVTKSDERQTHITQTLSWLPRGLLVVVVVVVFVIDNLPSLFLSLSASFRYIAIANSHWRSDCLSKWEK